MCGEPGCTAPVCCGVVLAKAPEYPPQSICVIVYKQGGGEEARVGLETKAGGRRQADNSNNMVIPYTIGTK